MNSPIPILTYHSLDETNSIISLRPEVFREQVRTLCDWGYQGITLGELLASWKGTKPLPPQPVVLTFDDGFRNVLEQAAPVLEEVRFRATVFVVAARLGGVNDWPAFPPASVPRLPLLSGHELRQLAKIGFEIGCHGATHQPLPGLSREALLGEIRDSRTALEQQIGRPVTTFAYPYGRLDRKAHAEVRRIYRAACGVSLGRASSTSDRWRLPRIEMYYFRRAGLFRLFRPPLGLLYLAVRGLGRTGRALLEPARPTS